MKPKIIIVAGPTATGKTDLSCEIAQRYNLPIINFDSLLFYHELNIGTAKPDLAQRNLADHYLIDVCSISHPMNAADFVKLAMPLIEKYHQQKTPVILVGGSGFYLRALTHGMYESVTTPEEVITQSNELYRSQGIEPFREILKEQDEQSFLELHQNDHYRIRRAVEHFWSTGTPFSLQKQRLEKNQKHPIENWDSLFIYLNIKKEQHWEIIERRTKRMLKQGLMDEVKGLLEEGFTGQEKPLQSIGYKEVLDFLGEKLPSPLALEEKINISTRQLAKAQRTWFNKVHPKIEFNPLEDTNKLFKTVADFIQTP